MNPDTQKKVLAFIKLSGDLIEALHKRDTAVAEQRQKAAQMIPDVVKSMVQHKRIDADDQTKAAEALQDPVQALSILQQVAAHRNDAEVNHLGEPAKIKQASANGNSNPNYLGNRNPDGLRESDRQLFKRLGVPGVE